MKFRFLFSLVAGFLLLDACNKESGKTIKELLSNKRWKVTQVASDTNHNGILDGTDAYSRDSTVTVQLKTNENGSGVLTFSTADTSGTAAFTWSLDADTYITTTIPVFSRTFVSKILSIDENGLSVILDTNATTKTFVFFDEE